MLMRTEGTFYARTEHGGHRVLADTNGFLVSWPNGSVRYPSARQTIMALVNQDPKPRSHHRDPKVTFDRYFRQGTYRPPEPAIDTLRLFKNRPDLTVVKPKAMIRTSRVLSIEAPVAPLGIDLEKRGHEVRKLFYAGYGRRVIKYGYDPDDVLQEIYKGLLVRNGGKCPFDPRKSSFGHYVHMVCGCIVSNYRRRYSRLERNEVFGVPGLDDVIEDVAGADIAIVGPSQEDETDLQTLTDGLMTMVGSRATERGMCATLSHECVGLMVQGYRKSEIARLTKSNPNLIARMLRLIREVAGEWRLRASQ